MEENRHQDCMITQSSRISYRYLISQQIRFTFCLLVLARERKKTFSHNTRITRGATSLANRLSCSQRVFRDKKTVDLRVADEHRGAYRTTACITVSETPDHTASKSQRKTSDRSLSRFHRRSARGSRPQAARLVRHHIAASDDTPGTY